MGWRSSTTTTLHFEVHIIIDHKPLVVKMGKYVATLSQYQQCIVLHIPSPAMPLSNRPIRVLLPQIGREPININKDDEYYKALKSRKETYIKNNDTHKDTIFFLQDLQ